MDIALIIAIVASLAGVALTVIPVLPGSLAPVAATAAISLIDGWDRFAIWFWIAQAALVALSFAVDNGSQAVGAKRLGTSRRAMAGGVLGTVIGPFALAPLIGPFALVFGAPIGAVAGVLGGEFWHRHENEHRQIGARDAARIGAGTIVIWLVSIVVRLVLISVQIALLILAIV